MTRTRAQCEADLREQVERMAHRTAAVKTLVEQYTAPLDGSAWVLVHLVERHGPVRSSELAERARLSRPLVSRALAALEHSELVAAHPDPLDGRAALVELTARGRQYLDRMAALGNERMSQITTGFSDGEVETLARLLGRLNDNAATIAVVPDRYRLES